MMPLTCGSCRWLPPRGPWLGEIVTGLCRHLTDLSQVAKVAISSISHMWTIWSTRMDHTPGRTWWEAHLSLVFLSQPHLSSVQSLSRVRISATLQTTERQASLSINNSQSKLKLMSIESVMPSNHLILCHPLPLASSQHDKNLTQIPTEICLTCLALLSSTCPALLKLLSLSKTGSVWQTARSQRSLWRHDPKSQCGILDGTLGHRKNIR